MAFATQAGQLTLAFKHGVATYLGSSSQAPFLINLPSKLRIHRVVTNGSDCKRIFGLSEERLLSQEINHILLLAVDPASQNEQ